MWSNTIHKLQTGEKIKLPILITYFVIFLITFFITAQSITSFANNVLQDNIHQKFANVNSFFDEEIRAQVNIQELVNFSMTNNELIIDLLRDNKPDYSVVLPMYKYLNEHNSITHFYLISPEKKTLYRAHQPSRFGDIIERNTMNQAASALTTVSGLEFGVLGTFTLRTVSPVINEGKLLGYVEVGMETGHVVERTEKQFNVELYELFNHDLVTNNTEEKLLQITGRKSDQHSLSDYVINYNKNIELTEDKLQRLKNSIKADDITQTKQIALSIRDVKDVAGNHVGKQILLTNIESLVRERDSELETIAMFYLINLVIGLVIFSFILSFIEAKLRSYIAEKQESAEIIKQNMEDLQAAQSELVEKEKLASLGKVVAGVSHEINTPIGIAVTMGSTIKQNVLSFADLLRSGKMRRSDLDVFEEDFKAGINVLLPSLDKASGLIHSFKQVAVDQTSEARREFNLQEVVDEIVMTLHHQFKPTNIDCSHQIDGDIVLDSFPGPLGQILTNLLNNALIHAFAENQQGEISIKAEQFEDSVIICIEDNGKGIAPENIDKIFDPFYTTRLGKGGSGLGLNIIYNIVVGVMGGNINVASTLGSGTCFTLNLPLIAPTKEL